ncbi:MAG TPA: isochorismatase family cysteine hydrolase, partial [Caulobacteraceae bacterium]|nr:isochorismatase family cysteine hydrolase [Caulobacteraceae bacterium]
VVIDVQEDFAAPGGAVARAGADLSGVPAALDRLEELLDLARAIGVAVAFACVETTPETDTSALRLLSARRGDGPEALDICRAGTPGADFHRVRPAAGEIVVCKRLYNAFHATELEAELRRRGVDTLVVVGFSTHCCVDATCRDAFHRDFNVFVVADATDAYDAARQRASLLALRDSCALIVDAAGVRSAWRSAAAAARDVA